METLTDKQARVLALIRRRIGRAGRPPTLREIMDAFGFRSTNAARRHLAALERKGYVRLVSGVARGIELVDEPAGDESGRPIDADTGGVPVVGRVAAGSPILAEENLEGVVAASEYFPQGRGWFALRVRGDSMTGDGILDGDLVVVRPREDFADNELGVIVVDGEATVKRLRRRAGHIELIPSNPDYAIRHVDPEQHEVRYAGQVVSVHRRM